MTLRTLTRMAGRLEKEMIAVCAGRNKGNVFLESGDGDNNAGDQ